MFLPIVSNTIEDEGSKLALLTLGKESLYIHMGVVGGGTTMWDKSLRVRRNFTMNE